MSGRNTKKPENKKEFIKALTEAAKKVAKPTITGTAKSMNIHRDTLYNWLKDFDVDFDKIADSVSTTQMMDRGEISEGQTYLIGEALVGQGKEKAHIDLLVGDKEGPVGKAFADGFSNLSQGHTPLLAVIRPNLPPKPHTLVVPKVTVQGSEDTKKVFGPVQASVAKAVADAVEEDIIPKDKVEDWVIICSVFVHPEAKDYRKIYQFNYGATKLALKRAMSKYPPLEKIFYDKDRAQHPIMGFQVPRLWRPPYLQISLDIPDLERSKEIISQIPKSDRIILEVGTPLIKRYGTKVISELREEAEDIFFVADLKTLDVGKVEVDLAYEETADAVVASGLAPVETLDKFIYEGKKMGIYAAVDLLNVQNPIKKLNRLEEFPDIIVLHRGIDEETGQTLGLGLIQELREKFKNKKFLIAVAGGIVPETGKEALEKGADILVVGRYITQSKDIERAVRELLKVTPKMRKDIDLFRVHVE